MKNILVTGGSRGIGKAIAKKYSETGYHVFTPSRDELNLNDVDSVKRFLIQYDDITFDVIINNAGINDINYIENVTDEEIYNMFQTNLISPIMLLRGLIPNMKQQKYGRIINIGSLWASVSKPGRSIYSATKNGIHGVTNTLALELAPYNILINTVCPGFTLTELTMKNNTPQQIEEISQEIPVGRMANPDEIAEIVYFLASEKNTYLTGQKIVVDGGYVCK